jgi:hypothetical protein
MNRQLMMMGAMSAVMGTIASASVDVICDADAVIVPRKRKPTAQPIVSPQQERKDKSKSLRRMLGSKGRA